MVASADEPLVERAKRGDMSAFELLVDRYERRVYNLAYRLMGNHEDASDTAQEAFIRVFQSLPEFRGDASFSTWLTKITTNLCLDELRRRKRQQAQTSLDEPYETEDGEVGRQVAAEGDGPERSLERKELQLVVQQGIQSLSEEYRSVVVLRDMQGLSYVEIADITGLSLGTVKSRLNRARQQLKEKLVHLELLPPEFVYSGGRGKLREM